MFYIDVLRADERMERDGGRRSDRRDPSGRDRESSEYRDDRERGDRGDKRKDVCWDGCYNHATKWLWDSCKAT